MQSNANLKVLFVAGFGPIVHNTSESRRLYQDVLGLPFKEESGGYLHTESIPGAKSLRCGLFRRLRNLVLARIPGPRRFLSRTHGLSSTWNVLKRRPLPSNRPGIGCL